MGGFELLKERLTTAQVFDIPGHNQKLVLTADASSTGIGAILQVRRDGLYYKRLSTQAFKNQGNYSATNIECYAIVHWVKHFKDLLSCTLFEIHNPPDGREMVGNSHYVIDLENRTQNTQFILTL